MAGKRKFGKRQTGFDSAADRLIPEKPWWDVPKADDSYGDPEFESMLTQRSTAYVERMRARDFYADQAKHDQERIDYTKKMLGLAAARAERGGSLLSLAAYMAPTLIMLHKCGGVRENLKGAFYTTMGPMIKGLAEKNPGKYDAFMRQVEHYTPDKGTHFPYDAHTAALDALALDMKHYDDMRDPSKTAAQREALLQEYRAQRSHMNAAFAADGVPQDDFAAEKQKAMARYIAANPEKARIMFDLDPADSKTKDFMSQYRKREDGSLVMPEGGLKGTDGRPVSGPGDGLSIREPETEEGFRKYLEEKITSENAYDMSILLGRRPVPNGYEASERFDNSKKLFGSLYHKVDCAQADGFDRQAFIDMVYARVDGAAMARDKMNEWQAEREQAQIPMKGTGLKEKFDRPPKMDKGKSGTGEKPKSKTQNPNFGKRGQAADQALRLESKNGRKDGGKQDAPEEENPSAGKGLYQEGDPDFLLESEDAQSGMVERLKHEMAKKEQREASDAGNYKGNMVEHVLRMAEEMEQADKDRNISEEMEAGA